VGDDDGIVSGSSGESATITHTVLNIAHHGSFRHGPERQHIPDGQRCLLATVHELARVHTLRGDEALLLVFEAEGVTERDLEKRRSSPGIVYHVRYHTLDVPVSLRVIQRSKPRRSFSSMSMGGENRSRSLPLGSDDPPHGATPAATAPKNTTTSERRLRAARGRNTQLKQTQDERSRASLQAPNPNSKYTVTKTVYITIPIHNPTS